MSKGTTLARVTGRSAAFALTREHLLVQPILEISNAKEEFIRRLAQLISDWDEQPITVKRFGSAARNEMTESSDIDLFLVMPETADRDETMLLVDHLASQGKH